MDDLVAIGKIEETKADVIVNSIGVGKGLKEYGGICGSILDKVTSTELKNKIDKAKDVYVLGEFFVTEGYGLPCKYIINLITPYFEDDPEMVIYADCIRRILNKCRKLEGVKTIAIPIVGIGANHYEHNDALDIIKKISKSFMETFSNKYKITIVEAEEQVSEANRARLARDMPEDGRSNIKKDVKHGSIKYLKSYKPQPINIKDGYKYFKYGLDEQSRPLVLLEPGFKRVFEYARAYTDKRYKDLYLKKQADDRVNAFLGYGKENPKAKGSQCLSEMIPSSNINSFYIVALALEMRIEEAKHFLNYFGKSFCTEGVDDNSDIVKDLLKNQIYDFYEIYNRVKIFN